jgi:hypothetical protein
MSDKVRTFTEEEIKETAREIAIRYKQLEKENERLRGILKSFAIPVDIDVRPVYYDFKTKYDVRANTTYVRISYDVDGHFRFVLERDE